MTTLELARRLAAAAQHPVGDCTPAEAVLAELHRNHCWLVRVRERDGITEDNLLPRPRRRKQTIDAILPFEASAHVD